MNQSNVKFEPEAEVVTKGRLWPMKFKANFDVMVGKQSFAVACAKVSITDNL